MFSAAEEFRGSCSPNSDNIATTPNTFEVQALVRPTVANSQVTPVPRDAIEETSRSVVQGPGPLPDVAFPASKSSLLAEPPEEN